VSHDAQAATCTEIGWAAYKTCSRCDYTTYEEIAALGHKPEDVGEDGNCIHCGEHLVDLVDVYGTNVGLYNDIGMNFFIERAEIEAGIAEGKQYSAVITKTYADGRKNVVYTIPYGEWTEQSADLYKFGFNGIAAKEMSDTVTVRIYTNDGFPASTTYTDSLRSYAMRMLENSNSSAILKTTLVDMLNYGAAAQVEFGYNTENLANGLLTEAQKALASGTVACTDSRIQGDKYYGTSVSLESNLVLTLYFTELEEATHAVVAFTDHYGNFKESTVQSNAFATRGELFGIVVDQLAVADMSQMVSVTVYNGDTAIASASDSIESYVARNDGTIYDTIMKFATSARSYFGSL
jgi:hypothetical protein